MPRTAAKEATNIVMLSSSGAEYPIRDRTPNDPPVSDYPVTFNVGLKANIGNDPSGYPLVPYFVGVVPNAAPTDDPSKLMIRILQNCEVHLNLVNSGYDCEFRYEDDDAVTLGFDPSQSPARYFNIQPTTYDNNNNCVGVSFNANYYHDNPDPDDTFTLYILVYFRGPDGARMPQPWVLRFDPELKNPGDNG